MDNFSDDISVWAKNQIIIKQKSDEIRSLKNTNNEMMNKLLFDIKEKNIDNNIFQITTLDVNIKVQNTKIQESITYKYMDKCIEDYFNEYVNKDDTFHKDNMLNYIKQKRKTTIKSNLTIIN